MKKLFILVIFSILANQFHCATVEAKTEDEIKKNLAVLKSQLLTTSLVEREPFSQSEQQRLSQILQDISLYLDTKPKLRTDPEISHYFNAIKVATEKLTELQKSISSEIKKQQKIAQRIKSPEKITQARKFIIDKQNQLAEAVKKINDLINQSVKESQKGFKFWATDKKTAWELINEYALFLKAAYEKMSKDLDLLEDL